MNQKQTYRVDQIEINYQLLTELIPNLTVDELNHIHHSYVVEKKDLTTHQIIWSAIVSKEELNTILRRPDDINPRIFKDNPLNWQLIKKEYLHNMTKYGIDSYQYFKLDQVARTHPKQGCSKDIFTDLLNDEYDLVKPFQFHTRAMKSLKGHYYVCPFILDSGYAQLENHTYLLDELIEHLSHRHDVSFITYMNQDEGKILYAPLKGDEEMIGNIITDLEHHLEDGESSPPETEGALILYYPKQEDIMKLIEWSYEKQGKEPYYKKYEMFLVERYIMIELLGGKEFLRSPPLDNNELPKRKFKNNK